MSVYTSVSKAELTKFIEGYNIGELTSFAGISAGMENTNYSLDTTEGDYILTLYEHYSKEEIPFFLDLMKHLSTRSVKTITAVIDNEGRTLKSLCGKPAALIYRLSGTALSPSEVAVAHCEIIGNTLAQFHLASMSFDQQRKHDRDEDLSPQLVCKLLPLLSIEDRGLLQQEVTSQQSIPWDILPSGIIHADLFCDNSIFDYVDNQPVLSGIIDLYLACNDAFIYDLAIVVNDWCCLPDGSLDEARWLPLLSAYHEVRPIIKEEKQVWIAMLRLSNLRFWMSRLNILYYPPEGDMVMQKNPDELKHKLQACLRNQQDIMQKLDNLIP